MPGGLACERAPVFAAWGKSLRTKRPQRERERELCIYIYIYIYIYVHSRRKGPHTDSNTAPQEPFEVEALQQVESAAIWLARRALIEEKAPVSVSCVLGMIALIEFPH